MVNSENFKFHFKGLSMQFKRDPQIKNAIHHGNFYTLS